MSVYREQKERKEKRKEGKRGRGWLDGKATNEMEKERERERGRRGEGLSTACYKNYPKQTMLCHRFAGRERRIPPGNNAEKF